MEKSASGPAASASRPAPYRKLVHAYDLIAVLVGRDIKIRYKRSVIGVAWSLLNPLAQVLVFTFLFQRALSLEIPHYGVYVFIGVIAWGWFSASIVAAPGAIISNPDLIRRPGFPVPLLPVLSSVSPAVPFALALPLLLAASVIDTGMFGWSLIALPAVAALQFLLCLGFSYLIAGLNVRYRDTAHLAGLAIMLGFYVTPVFYSAKALPPAERAIFDLNPMAVILTAYRSILIDHSWPDWSACLGLLVFSAFLLAMGYTVFSRLSTLFAEEI